jgi:hypothetical protein
LDEREAVNDVEDEVLDEQDDEGEDLFGQNLEECAPNAVVPGRVR